MAQKCRFSQALVNAGGVLMVFAEGRRYSCSDFGVSPTGVVNNGTNGQHDLVYRRSTDDGRHWGPLTRVVDANRSFPPNRFPTQHGSGRKAGFQPTFQPNVKRLFYQDRLGTNIPIRRESTQKEMRFLPAVWDVTPVYDRDTREVFVLFAGPGRQLGESTDMFVVSSRDFGLSWSAPANLSSSCGGGTLTPGDGVRKTPLSSN